MIDARQSLRLPSGAYSTSRVSGGRFASNAGTAAASRYRSRCESIRQSRRPTSWRGIMPYLLEQLLAQKEQTAETN